MKFREAREWAESRLRPLEDPKLEAELLLLHVMGWRRHRMVLNLDGEMPPERLHLYRELVGRRKTREPLQHITGVVEFMGREFRAGPGALVPRPETETLTEIFSRGLTEPEYLLDVGTGSGVIAVSLALEFPCAAVIGLDFSRDALLLARENRGVHGAFNLHLAAGDLTAPLMASAGIFDGIVANLPYVPSPDIDRLQPEVRNGDPVLALDGGEDGLKLVDRLLSSAPELLKRNGLLALELDPGQTGRVHRRLTDDRRWTDAAIHDDLAGHPRFVTARRKDGDGGFFPPSPFVSL
ncbi:MAG: peptide chain release factor N(5)-glutamine methyltransferase [Candidatus Aegiribacteria sp.]